MQSHRIISGATIFLMIVLVAAGWFLVAQPQLAAAATANTSLGDLQSQITANQATITELKGEQKNLPKYSEELASLRRSIPTDADSSAYITGLNSLASASGVTITGITVGSAVTYTAQAPAAPAPGSDSAATTPSPSPTPSATADTGSAASPVADAGWVPPSDARITSANFFAIPVAVTVAGSWDQSLAFVRGLQTGSRLFLINGLTSSPDSEGSGRVTASVKGYIFVLLDPSSAKLGSSEPANTPATSPSPTPTPTPAVTTSPNPSSSATPTPTPSSTPTKKP